MFNCNPLRLGAALLAVSALAGCGSGGSSGANGGDGGPQGLQGTPLQKLSLNNQLSCDAVKDYVTDSLVELILDDSYIHCLGCEVTVAGAPAFDDGAVSPDSFDDFTGTNNQESGVDELDRVEADQQGNFYLLDGNHLVVANGLPPADLRELAQLKLPEDSHAEGLLLDEQARRLVIALSVLPSFADIALSFAPPLDPLVELLFVNVSDPANPVVERRVMVEGYELAARRIGSRVHLVSHFTPGMPAELIDDPELIDLQEKYRDAKAGGPGDVDELAEAIRERVNVLMAAIDGQEFVPRIWSAEGDQDYVDITVPNCANVAIPDVTVAYALSTITSVDSDGTNVAALSVANNSWNVYASAAHVYLIQTSAGWWWDELQAQETAIYKVAIGPGAPTYRALGVVAGWADSSFQFSEHEGHLRVATNRWELDPVADRWLQDNHLFVLSDTGAGSLETVGSVRGFGAEERIFSARFLGDRGFVVTFRQIDPLFAFDLSDPRDPRLLGELEIPGVSTYLHPLDDSHLLTIGIDGDDVGLNWDIRLQIFDVQDLTDPRLIHSYVPEFTANGLVWSSAVYDHQAFNFFASSGVLTIPVQYRADELDQHFSGFAAFSVDTAAGFVELGRLDHSDLARDAYCPDTPGTGVAAVCTDGVYLESANPSRAVAGAFAGATYVYTLSDVGMKVSPAEDFSNPIAVLPLPYDNNYWWWPLQ